MWLMITFSSQLRTSSLYKLAVHKAIFCPTLRYPNTGTTVCVVTGTCNHTHLGTWFIHIPSRCRLYNIHTSLTARLFQWTIEQYSSNKWRYISPWMAKVINLWLSWVHVHAYLFVGTTHMQKLSCWNLIWLAIGVGGRPEAGILVGMAFCTL